VTLAVLFTGTEGSWGGSADKVKLKDIEVLTLRNGQFTKGRRSPGVLQLSCVGGTAGCGAFTPQVVQCYNKGSDGFDVQWECKTDMDNAYRFGRVEVSCEGYDYPDDPYVLKGSCGLEYTIDLTKEGMSQSQGQNQHNYYGGGGGGGGSYGWNIPNPPKQSNAITNIACGIVLVIIIYAIYKTCISPTDPTRQYSRTNDDYPDGRGGGGQAPPPPGFRPNYYGSSNTGDTFGDSCSAGAGAGARTARPGSSGGGFWTGAATGGLLGYMFGNRNNTGHNAGYGFRSPQTPFSAAPSSSYSFGASSSGSSSTGTRTASGFGGTRRR